MPHSRTPFALQLLACGSNFSYLQVYPMALVVTQPYTRGRDYTVMLTPVASWLYCTTVLRTEDELGSYARFDVVNQQTDRWTRNCAEDEMLPESVQRVSALQLLAWRSRWRLPGLTNEIILMGSSLPCCQLGSITRLRLQQVQSENFTFALPLLAWRSSRAACMLDQSTHYEIGHVREVQTHEPRPSYLHGNS